MTATVWYIVAAEAALVVVTALLSGRQARRKARRALAKLTQARIDLASLRRQLDEERLWYLQLQNDKARAERQLREAHADIAGLGQAFDALSGTANWRAVGASEAERLVLERAAQVDSEVTTVLAVLDPGVVDSAGLPVHPQCGRDHDKKLHVRECVLCKPLLHPAAAA